MHEEKNERQTAVNCVCVCVCVPVRARAADRCRLIVGMPERQTAVNVIVGVQERIPLSKRNSSCNVTRIAADRCQKRELT